jgi:hypothetical protein
MCFYVSVPLSRVIMGVMTVDYDDDQYGVTVHERG